jgi:hypothetical protein
VTPDVLEVQHHLSQLLVVYFGAFAQMTDLIILAKIAQQVTVTEKDGTRSMLANQGGFFTEMGIVGCHDGPTAGAAVAHFAGQAIDPTPAWAQTTLNQRLETYVYPTLQGAVSQGLQVCRFSH